MGPHERSVVVRQRMAAREAEAALERLMPGVARRPGGSARTAFGLLLIRIGAAMAGVGGCLESHPGPALRPLAGERDR
jgi:hypothetical protein